MNNLQKYVVILGLLSSALVLQSYQAMAISSTNDEVEISINEITAETQFNDNLNTTTPSAVTLDTLQNKIHDALSKVKSDKESGLVFATEELKNLYLLDTDKSTLLSYFEATIDSAQQLVEANSENEDAIKNAYDAIDTVYNGLKILGTKEVYNSFSGTDGAVWKDTNGVPIQAHGGQVQWVEKEGKWWWYGEDKTKGYRSNGISAYSSDDLYNWNFEGYVMRTISSREQLDTDQYYSELYKDYTPEEKDNVYLCINNSTSVIERPKMIYNEKNKQYVIWFHDDGPTEASPNSNYAAAAAGVAVSDSPNGPFKFVNRYRLNVCPENEKIGAWYESSAGFARDMNLWVDDDVEHTAYIVYSSEENRTMFITKLNDDYTYVANDVDNAVEGEDFVRLFPGAQREAPALFKYNNKYYLITSGATSWTPNQAKYWVADNILGEWTDMGDPSIADSNGNTFQSQSTNVTPVDAGSGKFIYMGDRWKSDNLPDSRYIWLPLEFNSDGKLLLKNYTDWTLDELENKYSVQVNSKIEDIYTNVDDLPKTLNIKEYKNGKWINKDTTVTWNIPDLQPMTQTTIIGTLDDVDREINVEIIKVPKNLEYYIDCGNTTESSVYKLANQKITLKNKDVCDKPYAEGSWGYTGTIGTDIDYKNKESSDAFDCGLWAYTNKTIDYVVPLKAGNYKLDAGFNEWWNTNRTMGINISYKDSNGQLIKNSLGQFTNNGKKVVEYEFEIPKDADVTISVYKPSTSKPDVILSWLALENITE